MAPMLLSLEAMLTYDTTDKIFFSQMRSVNLWMALDEEEWDREARRYYIGGIVGKVIKWYKSYLLCVNSLEINAICPLHTPIIRESGHYLNLYTIWSSYQVETEGTVNAYTSYVYTKKVETLAENTRRLPKKLLLLILQEMICMKQ